MDFETIFDVLRNSILITGLVIIMMLLIEYFNIHSKGKWFLKIKNSPVKQVLMSAGLGLIPGCIGGFAAVSLYTHRLISFGALIAMMICSSGDEAFVILAIIPEQGLVLFGILFVIGVVSGLVVDRVFPDKLSCSTCGDDYIIHQSDDDGGVPSIFKASSYKNLKNPSKQRVILLVGILAFISVVALGLLEHDHSAHAGDVHSSGSVQVGSVHLEDIHSEDAHSGDVHIGDDVAHSGHVHSGACSHSSDVLEEGHDHGVFNILNERWINLTFAIFSIITLLFTATARDHFIKEHLWDHIIKKHLLSIFLWTFGALLLCHIGMRYLDIQGWISSNILWVILLAVLIGVIPESGPHLVFVTLCAQGLIPFYVLLVNSIVQDGHTALPLLAESKSSFFKAKVINMAIGLFVGLVCYIFF